MGNLWHKEKKKNEKINNINVLILSIYSSDLMYC